MHKICINSLNCENSQTEATGKTSRNWHWWVRSRLLLSMANRQVLLKNAKLTFLGESFQRSTFNSVWPFLHTCLSKRPLALNVYKDSGLYQTLRGTHRHDLSLKILENGRLLVPLQSVPDSNICKSSNQTKNGVLLPYQGSLALSRIQKFNFFLTDRFLYSDGKGNL